MLDNIFFKRPKIKAILEQGLCAVDMHAHSEYSDSITRIRWILKKAKKKGFGIAISERIERKVK